MEFELWYLAALPLLFVAGWWLRGFDSKQREANGTQPAGYYRGLNLLLNDQPDKAIDAFIEVVKLDPETIELHHALGNLFRRRGEFDRAVRIHNHLLNRADLPVAERSRALAELGHDYMKGGLLDRAEDSFVRLAEDSHYRFDALRALLRIYQMEREWEHAIDTAQKLEREAGESHQVQMAHFHCELADKLLARGQLDEAQAQVELALVVNRKSARALVAAGDIAAKQGDSAAAMQLWRKIEAVAPEYVPMVVPRMAEVLAGSDRREDALNLLRRALHDTPSIDLLEIAARRTSEWEGALAAEALVSDELRRRPSLLGFEKLVDARLAARGDDDELKLLRSLLHSHSRKLARYRCGKCGFRAREFHWQCPGCSSWDSYPPRRIEELEAA
ncbi:MAG: lipopolysaccharide assembly protein LapB [Burkholderiaceae bacterium]